MPAVRRTRTCRFLRGRRSGAKGPGAGRRRPRLGAAATRPPEAHSTPRSFRLTKRPCSPTIPWSRISMPSSVPADARRRVRETPRNERRGARADPARDSGLDNSADGCAGGLAGGHRRGAPVGSARPRSPHPDVRADARRHRLCQPSPMGFPAFASAFTTSAEAYLTWPAKRSDQQVPGAPA